MIPLLSAKKISNVKPDFIIYDPVKKTSPIKEAATNLKPQKKRIGFEKINSGSKSSLPLISMDAKLKNYKPIKSSESQTSLRTPSKIRRPTNKYQKFRIEKSHSTKANKYSEEDFKDQQEKKTTQRQSIYRSKRKEKKNKISNNNVIVSVKSNVWGTKFKFFGHKYLPRLIGQIVYKTSLFHLQPRQMTITLEDLTTNGNSQDAELSENFEEQNKSIALRSKNKLNRSKSGFEIQQNSNLKIRNTTNSSNSIDDLSNYSFYSKILEEETTEAQNNSMVQIKNVPKFDSISSITDKIESDVSSENIEEINIDNQRVSFTSRDQLLNENNLSHQQLELPVLSLAENNSIEIYDSLEPNCNLITSKTVLDSNEIQLKR